MSPNQPRRQLKTASAIALIVLALMSHGCSSQPSATSEPTNSAEIVRGIPSARLDLTKGMKSDEVPLNGTYNVSYFIQHSSETCLLLVEAIERESLEATDMISEVLILEQYVPGNILSSYDTSFDWGSETFSGGNYAFQMSGACESGWIKLDKQ
jgi:hypothetical protein